jgi:hypothetical protein
MKNIRQRPAAWPVVAAGLALAGCGGAAKPSSPKTSPVAPSTRAQFIAQADAVCLAARGSLGQLQASTKSLLALKDAAKAYAAAAPLFRRAQAVEQGELSRLRALRPPAADAATVASYLQAGASDVALVGRFAEAFGRHDRTALVTLARQAASTAATTKGLAQGYGFKVCGHGLAGNGLT